MNLETTAGRLAALETFSVKCPRCGAPLFRPKALNRQTGKKMAGACMAPGCGYRQPLTTVSKSKSAPELEREGRMHRAVGYYNKFSVWGNQLMMTKDFHNFEVVNPGQSSLLKYGQSMARRIVNSSQPIHALIIGAAGVGKSHIANGILISVQAASDWRLTTMFVDWQKLLEMQKTAMHPGHEDVQLQVDSVMHQIGAANVVVIDDLGAERGTEFDRNLANQVFRLREDMTTVVTTNLVGNQLKEAYDTRTMSRMSAHSQGCTFAVSGINDQRAMK